MNFMKYSCQSIDFSEKNSERHWLSEYLVSEKKFMKFFSEGSRCSDRNMSWNLWRIHEFKNLMKFCVSPERHCRKIDPTEYSFFFRGVDIPTIHGVRNLGKISWIHENFEKKSLAPLSEYRPLWKKTHAFFQRGRYSDNQWRSGLKKFPEFMKLSPERDWLSEYRPVGISAPLKKISWSSWNFLSPEPQLLSEYRPMSRY